jgi:hypothetical protein
MEIVEQKMIYLSGKKIECTDEIGVMLSFNAGKTIKHGHSLFAADNGCFVQADKYSDDGFLNWLNTLNRENCLFASAPDVVGDAEATRKRAYPMLPKIRQFGFKAAYIVQDGETAEMIQWDELDAIFVGGSTEWKLSQNAVDIVKVAKCNGKWVHMGRVNSFKRIQYAEAIGCDSVDGTFLVFGPDKNEKKLRSWLYQLKTQPMLDLAT